MTDKLLRAALLARIIRSPIAGSMLGQRRRRWPNIEPAMGERIVLTGPGWKPLSKWRPSGMYFINCFCVRCLVQPYKMHEAFYQRDSSASGAFSRFHPSTIASSSFGTPSTLMVLWIIRPAVTIHKDHNIMPLFFIVQGVVHCVRAVGQICTQRAPRWLLRQSQLG